MLLVGYLSKAAALGFSAGVMPGPFQAYLIAQAARHGWRRAAVVALAPLITDGPIVLVVVFLLSRLPYWSMDLLRLVGGLFVLYLAWGIWRAFRSELAGEAHVLAAPGSEVSFLRAATINFLSPVVYIYWGTVSGPLFLEGWTRTPLLGGAFLLCFYSALIGISQVLIALVSGVRKWNPGITRWMLGLSALMMTVLAGTQVWAGVSALAQALVA
jgi:threonine/homoserine/homoserine lactone efflux protein